MPPKKVMVCAVRGCRRELMDINTITCHRFPLEVEEAAEWVRFAKNAYADHQFKLAGPIGVRQLFICSLHFEPSCYKVPGTKMTLKNGALPTLNEACEVPESELSIKVPGIKTNDASREDTEETITDIEAMEDGSSPGTGVGSRKRSNYRRASDRFFDFLMDDDDDDDEDLDLDLRQAAKIQKVYKPEPAKKKVPNKHGKFCLCNSCRKERAAKAMAQAITPNKSTQTEDRGPQPVASPVPAGASQDSCRLCFSMDQLEPLCSGMIVVRDEMLDKIYVCTGILIIPRPKESIFVCTPCAQLITSFHSYRQQVCSNNRALMRCMGRRMPEIAVSVKVRKPAPPVTPLTRQLPPGLTVTPVVRKVQAPLPPATQYRKIVPKAPLHMIQPEIPIVPPDEIKTEPEDPLEGCGEPALKIPPAVQLPARKPIKVPAPIVEVKKEYVPQTGLQLEAEEGQADLPEQTIKKRAVVLKPKKAVELKKVYVPQTGLLMEAEEGRDDLPEQESWKCWQCENSFLFQFECAKHMLQVHGENVAYIKQRMNLDELNANMLEMMSVHQRN